MEAKIISSTITDDNGIFLKIKPSNENYVVHMEYFYDYNGDPKGDVEAITSIYKNGEPIYKFFGTLEEVLDKLKGRTKEINVEKIKKEINENNNKQN